MKINEVIDKYSDTSVELNTGFLSADEGGPMVLIEGTSEALKMLAELIQAVSEDGMSGRISLSPFGAGSYHFSKRATLGLYINRLAE